MMRDRSGLVVGDRSGLAVVIGRHWRFVSGDWLVIGDGSGLAAGDFGRNL